MYECNNATARESKAAKQGAVVYASQNKETPIMLQRIVANFEGKVRHDEMEGRQYLVAPMVMLAEGVHNGSKGPLYYPSMELAKTPAIWNHKPVVVYHPQANGQMISACDPAVLTSSKVGVIMNTRFEDGKLKAECWMEESRIKQIDDRIFTALESGDPMELSTGLFSDDECCEGVWNDEAYEYIARNYRPDHLALLPDKLGAFSVEDGGGLMVNELSHEDIRSKLQGLVGTDGIDSPWVMMVFDKFFVYEDSDFNLWKQQYTVLEEDEVELVGAPVEVVKEVTFKTKEDGVVIQTNQNENSKEQAMKKKEIIEELISNESTAWTDEDKPALQLMNKDVLEKMIPIVNEEAAETSTNTDDATEETADGGGADDGTEETVAENETSTEEAASEIVEEPAEKTPVASEAVTTPITNRTKKKMNLDEYLKEVPAPVANQIRRGLAIEKAEKTRLVNTITSNDNCTFTEEFLMKKDIEELQAIAKLATNSEEIEEVSTHNYLGQSDPVQPVVNEKPLGIPKMEFSK